MKFTRYRPCKECPFRADRPGFLGAARAAEIADALGDNQTFACHKTLVPDDDGDLVIGPDSQHCAGALLYVEGLRFGNALVQLAERLGLYEPRYLDHRIPWLATRDAFIAHHSRPWAYPERPGTAARR